MTKGDGRLKYRSLLILLLFLFLAPFWGAAQAPPEDGAALPPEEVLTDAPAEDDAALPPEEVPTETPAEDDAALSPEEVPTETPVEDDAALSPVAVMPFLGDDLIIIDEFTTAVNGEIQNMGTYAIQPVDPATLSEALPPDSPPPQNYRGDSDLVLTAEYYIDTEDQEHFQVWLWYSDDGSLVYTDEMTFESMEEAQEYMPNMLAWIFSHVGERSTLDEKPVAPQDTVEKTTISKGPPPPPPPPFKPRLYLGLRGGGALNQISIQGVGNYEPGISQGIVGEGTVLIEFRPFRFFSVQAEGVFIYDTFSGARKNDKDEGRVRSTDAFQNPVLLLPLLLLKIPLDFGNMTLSPFLGAYYSMLPGDMRITPLAEDEETEYYTYRIEPPFGLTLGVDMGFAVGPGDFFLGLRFDRNIGMTIVNDPNMMRFFQNRVGLSVGYKVLIIGSR